MKKESLFPAQINIENEELRFINTTQEQLNSLPFHDSRLSQNKEIISSKKFSEINESLSNVSISFIFHTAFCGSTFLSRLLGGTDCYLSIREPNVFMELANLLRVNTKIKNNKNLFDSWTRKTVSSFLQLDTDKHVVFKPTNASNNMIESFLELLPESKALFLYSDLDSFLVSILKKGESGKAFIRNLYNILSLDGSPFAITDFRKVNCFTDLQIACLVWSMQMYAYQNISAVKYNNRIKFLNANDFLNKPKQGLIKISEFFGQNLGINHIQSLDDKGLFSSHAKYKDYQYNSNIRQQENQQIMKKYQNEFKEIHNWCNDLLKVPAIPSSSLHIKL